MKATLEFNLPDDKEDFDLATRALSWYSIVWDMDQYLRSRLKYEDSLSEDSYKALEEAREKLREIINDKGVTLE